MHRFWENQWADLRLAALLHDGGYSHVMRCKPAGP